MTKRTAQQLPNVSDRLDPPEFDFDDATAEKRARTPDMTIRAGGETFVMSATLEIDQLDPSAGTLGIIRSQLGGDEYDRFVEVVKAAPNLALDALVLNQMVGRFFDHLDLPNPFKPDGTIDRRKLARLGESRASAG